MLRMARKGYSCAQVARQIKFEGRQFSSVTVWRVLKYSKTATSSTWFPYKPPLQILATNRQEKQRIEFCEKYQNMSWRGVTFIDEKTLSLGTIPNRQNTRFWRPKGEIDDIPVFKLAKHSVSVNMFAAINYHGKSDVRWYLEECRYKKGKKKGTFALSVSKTNFQFCECIVGEIKFSHLPMNSPETIKSFQTTLLPFLKKTGMDNGYVLLDNATCHRSKKTIEWMKKNQIRYIPFASPPSTKGGYPPNGDTFPPCFKVSIFKNSFLTFWNLLEFADTFVTELAVTTTPPHTTIQSH